MGLFSKKQTEKICEDEACEKIEQSKFTEEIAQEIKEETKEEEANNFLNTDIHKEKAPLDLRGATGQTEEDLKKEFELFKIQKILHRIDHTLLKQNITHDDLKKLCQDANHYGFYSVCVHPLHVNYVKRQLGENSKVKVCSVISFPFGEDLDSVKAYQTKKAVSNGADEIDMVMNISALKGGDLRLVKKDIRTVVKAARKRPVKVIIETSLLSVKEIEQACMCIMGSGAKFVKTSTGYFGEGATPAIVKQIRTIVKENVSIKASGGVKTAEDAVALLNAGADRIGTSNGVAIAEGLKSTSAY